MVLSVNASSQTIIFWELIFRLHAHLSHKRLVSELFVKSQKNVRNPNDHYFSKKYSTTPPICIAIHLQFVLHCFRCPYALRQGKSCLHSFHLYRSTPRIFVLQYASQSYRSAFGKIPKILVVVVTGMFPYTGNRFRPHHTVDLATAEMIRQATQTVPRAAWMRCACTPAARIRLRIWSPVPRDGADQDTAKTWCIAKKGLFISCTLGGL